MLKEKNNNNAKSYFDKEGQSVFFESKEAEDVMLPTLGQGHQVSKAVNKYWFSLEHLNGGWKPLNKYLSKKTDNNKMPCKISQT